VSRLGRLSVRAYGRLTPEQKRAVDLLRYRDPDTASRGEAKTILGWKRTTEETTAYARKLIADGLMPTAAAHVLGVDVDHLRRLVKVSTGQKQARKPFTGAKTSGLTDKGKGVGHRADPHPGPERVLYTGDPFAYDFEAALRRATSA